MLLHQFVQIAKQEALKSPIKHKYGAVLIYGGQVISKGYNSFKRTTGVKMKQDVL
uniref:CMP/dCMP-type deaminase domain-containing protein n=1 Tax=viral metagenome TaxID=1070528 RepID=A0A6C0ACM5_9ZZZZ